MKIRIGIICPSEIAFRRFMPALCTIDEFEYVGVAVNSVEERYGEHIPELSECEAMLEEERNKADNFVKEYGGIVFDSYEAMAVSDKIDAIYIPLPPALHYKWADKALKAGKHVLVEKPSTISADDTGRLIESASQKGLAIHENYMFVFHDQLDDIENIIQSGEIGDVRLYRIRFGFPRRDSNDFRYNKELGGGALIDAGGYTLKYANKLLQGNGQIRYAQMNYIDEFDVDMYGSAALTDDKGVTVHIAYGMDNDYKCELEVWGSRGTLSTNRVLTAPAGYNPFAIISKNGEENRVELRSDDSFKKSILKFYECIKDQKTRENNYSLILKQAELVDDFKRKAVNK